MPHNILWQCIPQGEPEQDSTPFAEWGSAALAAIEGTLVPKTSIILADDNSAILRHVHQLLNKNSRYKVIAALNNGAAVLREYKRLSPDIIVLDISMELLSGIDVAQHLRDSGCHSKIIFLTVHEDFDYINAAMGVGGSAYVVKSRLSIDLIPAINAVLSHKMFVSPSLLYTL